jgi:hypothetical protein
MNEIAEETKKRRKIPLWVIIIIGVALLACCGIASLVSTTGDKVESTATPQQIAAATIILTATPMPTKTTMPSGTTMYFCGYDRCRDSGEYGQLIFNTGINVWNGPEPDRGGVHHQASHEEKAIVINEKRVDPGPGGLWYELSGGGWTNDLWLTDEICTATNLGDHSFTDCMMGEY